MKKRFGISAMTVFFAMLLGIAVMFAGTEQASAMKGDGSAYNPYQISTYNDLKEFAEVVNGNHPRIQQNTAACAILTADIDATGNSDLYLDKNGNPVRKNSTASHILPEGEQ